MTPTERHAVVSALLNEALDIPEAERDAWLQQHCDSESVRRDVQALLLAGNQTDGFLEEPLLTRSLNAERPSQTGKLVGPWKIENKLGEGGMGTVYRANRADGLYRRAVALKLLSPGGLLASGERLHKRMAAERQILARLEHEGIARLYDGGVTDDGAPYLALELVDGEPITAYAQHNNLSIAERVGLFCQACNAVGYAHRNLVVHRDLKPAHILVSANEGKSGPSVKLLDFGISALLESPDELGETLLTVPKALTPTYAAPEQILGKSVTTASDIYSLGVVLYELLTDNRPYDLGGKTAAETERLVVEIDPLQPSSIAPEHLRKPLRGDLDIIVMKALAKEPERRYASVDGLAEDLRRHLGGIPVQARPATTTYRVGKFIRRHRVGVGITTTVLALTIALVGFYTLRLANERDRTADALAQTEGTLTFLEDTILSGEAIQGDYDAPLSAVLDSAAVRVGEIEDPAVASAVRFSLASVYNTQGRIEEAEALARDALSFYDENDVGVRPAMITNLIAMTIRGQGDPEGAIPYHEQAIDRLREVVRAGEDANYELSSAMNELGATFFNLERLDEAEAIYREAVDMRRTIPGLTPGQLTPLHNLANLLANKGELEEAAQLSSEMASNLENQKDNEARYMLGFALFNWATALNYQGLADSAIVVRQRGIEVGESVYGVDHPDMFPDYLYLTSDYQRANRLSDARQNAERVLRLIESTYGDDHSLTAWARVALGNILCDVGEPEEGTTLVERGLADRQRLLPDGHRRIPESKNVLGHCYAQLGRTEEGEELLVDGYETLRNDFGDEHIETIRALERLDAFRASQN